MEFFEAKRFCLIGIMMATVAPQADSWKRYSDLVLTRTFATTW